MQSIGLDVGTRRIRASIHSVTGRLLHQVSIETNRPRSPKTGFVEINPETVFRNVCSVLGNILARTSKSDIMLSISCMAPVMVLLDEAWKPVCDALLYNDARSSMEVRQINGDLGEDRMLDINGNIANIQQWLPKILWMKRNRCQVMDRVRHVMDLSSYLIFRLTGENVIDYTVALEAGLLDFRKRNWSGEIIGYLGLDETMLPELHETCDIAGNVKRRTVTTLSGSSSRRQIAVNAGCVDAVASAVSAGCVSEGRAAVVLGSTGIISYSTSSPRKDRRLYLDMSPIHGLYYLGGGTASAGLFVDYIADLVLGELSGMPYVDKLAASSTPGAGHLIMLPYIYGERTPVFDPMARSIIFGLASTHSRADVIRASLEAVGYSILDHFTVLSEMGYRPEAVRLTGGAARSRIWRQILSDMLGLPLIYNDKISGSMGASFMGYVSAGEIHDWQRIDRWRGSWIRHIPDMNNTRLYSKLYSEYKVLYAANAELMHGAETDHHTM